MYASERQVSRLRLAFLRAVLSQEIGAFDTDLTNAKVISGISNHMRVIQDAIGEKVEPTFSPFIFITLGKNKFIRFILSFLL